MKPYSEVSDSPMQNLIPYFPDAKNFIGSALDQGGRVFVHCNGGISRSPAFVVAYVMESQKWDYHSAFSFVQNKVRQSPRPFTSVSILKTASVY